jgi:hypothetical protein
LSGVREHADALRGLADGREKSRLNTFR